MATLADLYLLDNLYAHCETYLLRILRKDNASSLISCTECNFALEKMISLRAAALYLINQNLEELK